MPLRLASAPVDEPLAPAPAPEPESVDDADDAPPSSRRLIPYYAAALLLLAAALLSGWGFEAVGEHPVLFGGLVVATFALDSFRIELFERAKISPAALPVLALACMFGAPGPIAAEIVIAVGRAIRRTPPVKFTFDLGALSLAGIAAAHVFAALPAEGALMLAVGALAGLAYYAVNMPLLAIVISLAQGGSPLANWREQLAWLLPHYPAYGALAGLFVLSYEQIGVNAVLMFGLPAIVLWVAEHQYVARSEASVAELRRSHDELEGANRRLRGLLDDNQALLHRIQSSYLSTITSLARTIEAKDPYTGGHTERVARVARILAEDLGMDASDLAAVEVGAIVHDIGKIGVPDHILLKPGPLDDTEREEMQKHPEVSAYIVAELDLPPIVKQMVRNHHERWDGRGYPDGLSGDEIPLAARILAVADSLDAMTSTRPYREAMPLTRALEIIAEEAGRQFCPTVVRALQRRLAEAGDAPLEGAAESEMLAAFEAALAI